MLEVEWFWQVTGPAADKICKLLYILHVNVASCHTKLILVLEVMNAGLAREMLICRFGVHDIWSKPFRLLDTSSTVTFR